MSMVLDPRVAGDDLIAHILTDFGITRANSPIPMHARRQALSAALQRFLRELIPVNRYAVIVIDEAQHLEPVVLEQLRLLMNFETDEAKLLQVVLVGQPELERRLREPEMQAFDQRVARRCEMQPLSGYEVKRYIDRRLSTAQQLAGSWRGTFTPCGGSCRRGRVEGCATGRESRLRPGARDRPATPGASHRRAHRPRGGAAAEHEEDRAPVAVEDTSRRGCGGHADRRWGHDVVGVRSTPNFQLPTPNTARRCARFGTAPTTGFERFLPRLSDSRDTTPPMRSSACSPWSMASTSP